MESLVLFAKVPILGTVKTRLAQKLGKETALKLYDALLRDSLALLRSWQADPVGKSEKRVRVYLSERTDLENPPWTNFQLNFQEGDDLGQRMKNCFKQELADGASKVAIIGSDSPTLPLFLLRQAFLSLDWHDFVLGPTFDGGYWLVGARDTVPHIFDDIPWSTSSVMSETVAQLKGSKTSTSLLPFWYDVDNLEDLQRVQWHAQLANEEMRHGAQNTFRAVQKLSLDNI